MSGTRGWERIPEVPAGVCPDVANTFPLITYRLLSLPLPTSRTILPQGVSEETTGDKLGLETATTTSGMRWAKWATSSPCKALQHKFAVVRYCSPVHPHREGTVIRLHAVGDAHEAIEKNTIASNVDMCIRERVFVLTRKGCC